MDGDAPAVPCGLFAKAMFNDTYQLKDESGKKIEISNKDIAWDTDKEFKFKNMKKDSLPSGKSYKDVQWYDIENGKFLLINY